MMVIRIRGSVHVNYKIEDTMKMLRLHKPNHSTILYADKSVLGMLKKVKDYCAFGEISEEVLLKLLRNRALIIGNNPLTNEHLKNKSPETPNIKSLAKALMDGKVKIKDIYNLKPVFRLHPPRGGHRGSIKKHYNSGGVLGNVGTYINILTERMI
ncbi:MAG: 50S ribosomal protein L30 [archaeon]|nr:50S ribosomal protein L30 [archaeon]